MPLRRRHGGICAEPDGRLPILEPSGHIHWTSGRSVIGTFRPILRAPNRQGGRAVRNCSGFRSSRRDHRRGQHCASGFVAPGHLDDIHAASVAQVAPVHRMGKGLTILAAAQNAPKAGRWGRTVFKTLRMVAFAFEMGVRRHAHSPAPDHALKPCKCYAERGGDQAKSWVAAFTMGWYQQMHRWPWLACPVP